MKKRLKRTFVNDEVESKTVRTGPNSGMDGSVELSDIKDLDSIVVAKVSGEIICVIGLDDESICHDDYKVHFCKDDPGFTSIEGQIFMGEGDDG